MLWKDSLDSIPKPGSIIGWNWQQGTICRIEKAQIMVRQNEQVSVYFKSRMESMPHDYQVFNLITDAETREVVSYVISYDSLSKLLSRYAQPVKLINGDAEIISETREVVISIKEV
jgi:hypothetical protein